MKITCGKCGCFLDLSRIGLYSYCKLCHAEYMRLNRPKHSELNPEQKKKDLCRSYANRYERLGKLIPQPCEKCGETKVEKHHEDYDKPLEVKWLCRPCHLDLHSLVKVESKETECKENETILSTQ